MDEVTLDDAIAQASVNVGPDPRWSRIDKIRWHLHNDNVPRGKRFTSAMIVNMMPELETKDAYNSLFHMATKTGELEMDHGLFRVIEIRQPSGRVQNVHTKKHTPRKKSTPRVKDGLLERVGKVGDRTVVRDRATQQIYALTELK